MSHLTTYLDQLRDQADLTVLCHHCPDWSFSGNVVDAKLAAREHRERHHPKRKAKKHRRRH
jgi:hypothetical protein